MFLLELLVYLCLPRRFVVLFMLLRLNLVIFFFNDTATTEIYTLSLHDALPISLHHVVGGDEIGVQTGQIVCAATRSEEHTSELQSQSNLVCRLLLEKKKPPTRPTHSPADAARSRPSTDADTQPPATDIPASRLP